MVILCWAVNEVVDNGMTEPFGYQDLATVPRVGDVLLLHWLDGKEAYPVRVVAINADNLTMRVQRVMDEVGARVELLLDSEPIQVGLLPADLTAEWLAWTDALRERREGWRHWAVALHGRLRVLDLSAGERDAYVQPLITMLRVLEASLGAETP